MTPFAVVISWAGRPVSVDEADALLEPVGARCEDGRTCLAVPGAAIAVGLRASDRADTLSGGFLVQEGEMWAAAGDVRLYDRERLVEMLGRELKDESDLSLLSRAYRRFGEASLKEVAGDFAMVIWDWAERRVHAVRDHFGLRLLHWRQTRDGIALASDAHQLLGAGPQGAEADPDPDKALDYLLGKFSLKGHSFFSGIHPLTPGHSLVTGEGVPPREQRYWRPSFEPFRGSYPDAVEGWRERFRLAIHSRVKFADGVASYLSGGIDSSAIVGAVHEYVTEGNALTEKRLGLSALFPGFHCDESRYSAAVQDRCPTFRFFNWDATERNSEDLERPFLVMPGLREGIGRGRRQEFPAAHAANCRVLLGGGGGESLGWSHGVLLDLAVRGKVMELARQLRATGSWRRAARSVRADVRRRWPPRRHRRAPGWLTPPLQQAFRRQGEAAHFDVGGPSNVQSNAWRALSSPRAGAIIDIEVRAAAEAGFEMRLPYLDVRLVEFTLGLPWHLRLPGGDTRKLQRDAVAPFLPAAVLLRREKAAFGPMVTHQIRKNLQQVEGILRTGPWMSEPFVDRASVLATLDSLKENDGTVSQWRPWDALWKVAVYEVWLRRVGNYDIERRRRDDRF